MGLNPFRTGQCLSTRCGLRIYIVQSVLIPFVQGNVFRRKEIIMKRAGLSLNPFRTGQCLST